MKERFLFFTSLALITMLLVSCKNAHDSTRIQPFDEIITVSDAQMTIQTWLVHYPIRGITILEYRDDIIIDDEEYYAFYTDSNDMYWFSVLVHKTTGELLQRTVSDGQFPTEYIEPLDDWYNRGYS